MLAGSLAQQSLRLILFRFLSSTPSGLTIFTVYLTSSLGTLMLYLI